MHTSRRPGGKLVGRWGRYVCVGRTILSGQNAWRLTKQKIRTSIAMPDPTAASSTKSALCGVTEPRTHPRGGGGCKPIDGSLPRAGRRRGSAVGRRGPRGTGGERSPPRGRGCGGRSWSPGACSRCAPGRRRSGSAAAGALGDATEGRGGGRDERDDRDRAGAWLAA